MSGQTLSLAADEKRIELDAEPRTLRRDHLCEQDIGLRSTCDEPAYDRVDGAWVCDWHAVRFEVLIGLAQDDEES